METCHIVALHENNLILILGGGLNRVIYYHSHDFNRLLEALWEINGGIVYYESYSHPKLSPLPLIAFYFYPNNIDKINAILDRFNPKE